MNRMWLTGWMVAGLCSGAVAVHAADYPSKTVELVVAGNPGGGLDLVGLETGDWRRETGAA